MSNSSNSLLRRWDKVDCWAHSLYLFDIFLEVKDIDDITLLKIPYKFLASFSQIEESSVQLIIFYLGPKKKQRDLAVLCVSDQS
ncbi:hypothetical protein WR25_02386 [Diploscapter pachys]|uniref:Uncharacterized protein n=1 Tax=Diploscapter pachys TaxID=2018661 RepID=A0A2A2LLZ7_9BILA|nr:hypothetical protein WR25_02386 [Diploscapter pachys]